MLVAMAAPHTITPCRARGEGTYTVRLTISMDHESFEANVQSNDAVTVTCSNASITPATAKVVRFSALLVYVTP